MSRLACRCQLVVAEAGHQVPASRLLEDGPGANALLFRARDGRRRVATDGVSLRPR